MSNAEGQEQLQGIPPAPIDVLEGIRVAWEEFTGTHGQALSSSTVQLDEGGQLVIKALAPEDQEPCLRLLESFRKQPPLGLQTLGVGSYRVATEQALTKMISEGFKQSPKGDASEHALYQAAQVVAAADTASQLVEKTVESVAHHVSLLAEVSAVKSPVGEDGQPGQDTRQYMPGLDTLVELMELTQSVAKGSQAILRAGQATISRMRFECLQAVLRGGDPCQAVARAAKPSPSLDANATMLAAVVQGVKDDQQREREEETSQKTHLLLQQLAKAVAGRGQGRGRFGGGGNGRGGGRGRGRGKSSPGNGKRDRDGDKSGGDREGGAKLDDKKRSKGAKKDDDKSSS